MTASPRPLVAGNWKMNGLRAALGEIGLMAQAYDSALKDRVDLLVCPPATLLHAAASAAAGSGIGIGAQDCHASAAGALACTRLGAQSSIPLAAEVGALIQAQDTNTPAARAALRALCSLS